MNKQQYDKVRADLVRERKRLIDVLESQEDFPNQLDIIAYEVNKKAIMDLDDRFNSQRKEKSKHE
jgi:hypothetical protein